MHKKTFFMLSLLVYCTPTIPMMKRAAGKIPARFFSTQTATQPANPSRIRRGSAFIAKTVAGGVIGEIYGTIIANKVASMNQDSKTPSETENVCKLGTGTEGTPLLRNQDASQQAAESTKLTSVEEAPNQHLIAAKKYMITTMSDQNSAQSVGGLIGAAGMAGIHGAALWFALQNREVVGQYLGTTFNNTIENFDDVKAIAEAFKAMYEANKTPKRRR